MTDLDALRALYAKATPGEWHEHWAPKAQSGFGEHAIALEDRVGWIAMRMATQDAQWLVALHNEFPSLAAELESLRAVYAACVVKYPNGAWACELCEGLADGHAEGCPVAAHERLMAE